jgi:hypothetical protein
VLDVEDFLTGDVRPVHVSRLRLYSESSLDATADLRQQIAHNQLGYDVHALQDIRFGADVNLYLVRVSCLGFDDGESTWEPLVSLIEDVPEMVEAFLNSLKDKILSERARASLA